METNPDLVTLRDFAIALFIGALIGIDRQKRIDERGSGSGIGGIRTFPLISILGAVSAWLSVQLGSTWIFIATLVVVSTAVIVGHQAQTRGTAEARDLTTVVAAFVALFLGGATLFGYPEVAVALAIATSAILAFKGPIHGTVERIGYDDLYAGLKLLIATFIVLPLLPNRAIDPWGAVNPYEAWALVILISTISLGGYVAVRWLGASRGTALTGLFGGLASSTAVTLGLARRSVENDAAQPGPASLAAGILLAWATMFGRILVEAAIVHPPLVLRLLAPIATMALAALALALYFLHQGRRDEKALRESVPLVNPFSLGSAVRFAALFTAVLLVVALARRFLSAGGLLAIAAIAGLTDVDAITLSMARLARDNGQDSTAVVAIGIAAISNTLVKAGLVSFLGAPKLRARLLLATAVVLASGGLALIAV